MSNTSFNISTELTNIQNNLIKNQIKTNTNVNLIQSEQGIRDLYKSYADMIKNVGSKLFDFKKFIVNSQELITKDYFDELFQSIYIDLKSLYTYIKYIDTILQINLEKNIAFYNTLEKKIIELENKLDLARLNTNNITTFDKVFFEGFSNTNKSNTYINLELDKKIGHIGIKPISQTFLNKSYQIKNIKTSLFPVPNNEGGVFVTTDVLNTYADSYHRDGTNDMLENGLWKEQVFTNEVPDLELYINKEYPGAQLYKLKTQGIAAYVDIEFKYAVDINGLDIDLFGQYDTSILYVFYKHNENEPWNPLNKLVKSIVDNDILYIDGFGEQSDTNIIKFKNFELINARFIRIVFNQKHYTLINNAPTGVDKLTEKLNNDLSERRLELIKIDGGSAGEPAIPKSFNYDSLYSELTKIIEYSANINEMLIKIIDVLEPTTTIIKTDFNKTLQYELGAWSITPMISKYTGKGIFKSGNYIYSDKSLVVASLITKQEEVKENTCNWYISSSKDNILLPIIPNNEIIKKESINILNSNYLKDLGWKKGIIVLLDFPISYMFKYTLVILKDGIEITYNELLPIFLNSRLIYFPYITDGFRHNYIIKYIPAKYDTVNVYKLQKNGNYTSSNTLEYHILSPRESVLKLFLDKTNLKENYTIKRVICTVNEYKLYFENKYNICISQEYYDIYNNFIDTFLYPNIISAFKETLYQEYLSGIINDADQNLEELPTMPLYYERTLNG